MKIIGRIEEVKFNGRNPFIALTCGEEGRGRKLGFIGLAKSLMDKLYLETEKEIKEMIEDIEKRYSEGGEEYNRILEGNKWNYEDDKTLEWIVNRTNQQSEEQKKELIELKTKNIKKPKLERASLIVTPKMTKILVEEKENDKGIIYATNWYGGYRGGISSNIEELENNGFIEILVTGETAEGDAGRMGGETQYIFKVLKDCVLKYYKQGRVYGEPRDWEIVFNVEDETAIERPFSKEADELENY